MGQTEVLALSNISLSIQYFIDINILPNHLIDININTFKNFHINIDINIFKKVPKDIDKIKNDHINIGIGMRIGKKFSPYVCP